MMHDTACFRNECFPLIFICYLWSPAFQEHHQGRIPLLLSPCLSNLLWRIFTWFPNSSEEFPYVLRVKDLALVLSLSLPWVRFSPWTGNSHCYGLKEGDPHPKSGSLPVVLWRLLVLQQASFKINAMCSVKKCKCHLSTLNCELINNSRALQV